MSYLLEFAGTLLYLVISIIVFPLFVLLQLLLLTVPLVKSAHLSFNRLTKRWAKARKSYHFPHVADLIRAVGLKLR